MPHREWYSIYQLADEKRPLKFGPYFSTTADLADPKSWTKPQPMIETLPEGGTKTKWIDFWVICDAEKAHLFYTSDDGHFWRRETSKQDFPLRVGGARLGCAASAGGSIVPTHKSPIPCASCRGAAVSGGPVEIPVELRSFNTVGTEQGDRGE